MILDLRLLDYVGKLMSCMVSVFLCFRFFDERYIRSYASKYLYMGWKILCCLLNFAGYLFNNPLLNITFWISVILITSRVFYYDPVLNKRRYYIMNVAFVFATSVCEAVGGILAETGIRLMHIEIERNVYIIGFVCNLACATASILLYYLVLRRLFIPKRADRIHFGEWAIYAVITAHALVNIGEILFLIKHELGAGDYLFLMADGLFIIVVNLYLFSLLNAFAENKDLKCKLILYERQAKSNYNYYAKQMDNHMKALAVIHDVRKHMRIAEAYEQSGEADKRKAYADDFEEMIAPLMMFPYCENAILNIIINDKAECCKKKGISFEADLKEVDIEFMKPIDVTTIFGNLLDNAVEACETAKEKKIWMRMYPFNGLVYVKISNTYAGIIKRDGKGKPISDKGGQHGIGLANVEQVLQVYHGNMQLLEQGQIFSAEIMFNRP